MRSVIALEQLEPCGANRAASSADALGKVLPHTPGHQKLLVLRPTVDALRQAHFVVAERLTVRRRGVLLVRRSVSNVAVNDDERWTIGSGLESGECPREPFEVIGIAHT